ncbi:MAG TPA: hypothetical protein VMQ50_15700 [Casimicrobiaceae bacterium]|nr:hypothetical protein [Casimicrobiaceae bacterium]
MRAFTHWTVSQASSKPPPEQARHRRKIRARGCAAAIGLSAVLPTGFRTARGAAEGIYGIEAGAFYDSNLTQAQNAPGVRADGAATLSAFAGSFATPSGEGAISPPRRNQRAPIRSNHSTQSMLT